jgi:all-trans-8'-apo-beta-carotenal 15,15'-oxygenase
MSLSRRRFLARSIALSGLSLFDPWAISSLFASDLGSPRRLSALAYKSTDIEGRFRLTRIEGALPPGLKGTFCHVGPGRKDSYGKTLNHLFDGDAYVSRFEFKDGEVTLDLGFVGTPERLEEVQAGKVLYNEFGTLATTSWPRKKNKNQPNVNVIEWDGKLLALSEGGAPLAIDPRDLSAPAQVWDFHGTLPKSVAFSAHPKIDAATGEAFGFGTNQGLGFSFNVYKMKLDGTLSELYSLHQEKYRMIHDMTMSENYLVFIIPPVEFNVLDILSGATSIAGAIKYFENKSGKILILRRDGEGAPISIEIPACMIFHHGNAFEKDGKLCFDSLIYPNSDVLEAFKSFSKDKLPPARPAQLTRFEIDLEKQTVSSRVEWDAVSREFPRFDPKFIGKEASYLYTLAQELDGDSLANTSVCQHHHATKTMKRYAAPAGRMFGEAIVANGSLLMLGYDSSSDQTFLEILDAESLDFQARVWTERYFPLGFHGNFYLSS